MLIILTNKLLNNKDMKELNQLIEITIDENIYLWNKMVSGEYINYCLRLKVDMKH